MSNSDIEKIDLASEDVLADKIAALKELFPEVVTEGDGTVDFEALRLALGDEVNEGKERYSFTWPGKRDAIRQSQTMSHATLLPDPEKSVDWDTTRNLYIEGDNLEVLKLLQRGYHGKVKLIYIDPPYNTGENFVYKDKFGDTIANYKEQAGTGGQANPETSGRFHSNWLSMMYPRLKLARELLTEDGAVFISIDDKEQANLVRLCNDVFGEQNFIADVIWQKRTSPDARKNLAPGHDYVLVYGKNKDAAMDALGKIELSEQRKAEYRNPDNDPRGPWASVDMTGQAGHATPDQFFEIETPSGRRLRPPAGRCWALAQSTFEKLRADGRIWFGESGDNVPRTKNYLSESDGMYAWTLWGNSEVGHNQEATKEVKALFDGVAPFDTPKPVRLMDRILTIASDKNSLVLDFFSGSATMAHAVMAKNAEDSGHRNYVMVQIPEVGPGNWETLCDVGEERIRRAGAKIAAEIEEQNRQLELGEEQKPVPDVGFRVLKLDSSNILTPEPGELVVDRVKPDRSELDIVFEMMLKWGMELDLPVRKETIAGYDVWNVGEGTLICCLAPGLTMAVIGELLEQEDPNDLPSRIFVLDSVLDDSLKLNLLEAVRAAQERTQRTVELRTV